MKSPLMVRPLLYRYWPLLLWLGLLSPSWGQGVVLDTAQVPALRGGQVGTHDNGVNGNKDQGREYAGVIYPAHELSLSMGVSGLVSSVAVRLGDAVSEGQLILQLDDTVEKIEEERRSVIFNNRAELESLEERIERTESLMEDVRQLYEGSGSVALDEVIRVELDYFSLLGRYQQQNADKARERLEYQRAEQERRMRRLESPIHGYITHLDIDKGEWVTADQILLQVVDTSVGILRLAVPELVAQQLAPGMVVPVRFDAYPALTKVEGEVTFVSVAADPASSLVKVEVTFENRALKIRPGGKGFALLPSMGLPLQK